MRDYPRRTLVFSAVTTRAFREYLSLLVPAGPQYSSCCGLEVAHAPTHAHAHAHSEPSSELNQHTVHISMCIQSKTAFLPLYFRLVLFWSLLPGISQVGPCSEVGPMQGDASARVRAPRSLNFRETEGHSVCSSCSTAAFLKPWGGVGVGSRPDNTHRVRITNPAALRAFRECIKVPWTRRDGLQGLG